MGAYTLEQPAPIPQWQQPGDPRQEIRIMDIMRMSRRAAHRAPQDPGYDKSLGYPDHLWYYTGAGNSYEWAATRPAAVEAQHRRALSQHRPPVLANLPHSPRGREARRGLSHLRSANLFDKLGIRDATLFTDPYGNNLTQGAEFLAARDWVRLGNLYVQDGVWNGEPPPPGATSIT
ncbi:MAG: hypothetical protein IPK33_11425 [Gemmatimonadetes bacterium]|nr:hypothetical protein [Gemmatimonadota bacterium]